MYELEKRFCKDRNISITIFEPDIFEDRLRLFEEYNRFRFNYQQMIEDRFKNNGQAYLEYYNRVKDDAINYIKNSPAYRKLQEADMNQFKIKSSFPKTDVYKETEIGHKFLSIDLAKANFSILVYFARENQERFFDSYDYRAFMGKFTDIEHIIDSKYIRQVIFGNCNPKRQIDLEAYLTNRLLTTMLGSDYVSPEDVYSQLNDEIILRADNMSDDDIAMVRDFVNSKNDTIPLHFEEFTLGRVRGSEAYVKRYPQGTLSFKCLNPDEAPFVLRFMRGEEYRESDFVFEHNHRLARFIEAPELSLDYGEKQDLIFEEEYER